MMAAFSSYQYHPFLPPLDSTFFHNLNTTTILHQEEGFSSDFNNNNNNINNNINNDQISSCNKVSLISSSDNEPSTNVSVTTRNLSPQSSMVVDKLEMGEEQVTQKITTTIAMERKRRTRHGSSSITTKPQPKDGTTNKRTRKNNNGGGMVKNKEEDEKPKAERIMDDNKSKKKGCNNEEEEPPKGYIHVRARRGQATDSHSLAERVRREKISERMKMLQRLVPGCDKVTGKALMLDEIINYVQSLQNQVEFLSMKLASVSPIFYDLATTDLDNNTLLVRPEKLNIQHCSGSNNQQATTTTTTVAAAVTAATTTTTFPTTTNDHYLLDSNSASAFLHQGQRSNIFFEGSSQFWDTEEQRQKFLHPYEFINNNNLCSFH